MILLPKFGYALRHKFTYEAKTNRGSLLLWFSDNGARIGSDPIVNNEKSIPEFLAMQFQRHGGSFSQTEIPIGDDHDLLSILVSLIMVKNGREYSFSNYQDRMISFSISEAGKKQQKIISVKIRYNSRTGVLTLDEVNELEAVTRHILAELGYSYQDIKEKLESMP